MLAEEIVSFLDGMEGIGETFDEAEVVRFFGGRY